MFRLVWMLVLAAVLQANTLVDLYLSQGIEAVEKKIQESLISKAYWEESLKGKDLSLGYYQNLDTLLVAHKSHKTMDVFDIKEFNPKLVHTYDVIVGKDGDKQKEGDLKTPLGVYDVMKKFTPSDPFYGPLAYTLSYPNTFDKVEGKNGYGIWIHGSPIDGSARDPMSKGCIVMDNNTLVEFSTKIHHEKAIILVSENGLQTTNTEEVSSLLAELFKWKKSWQESDVDAYLSFYSREFKRYDGLKFEEFSHMKRYVFSNKDDKEIVFENINISPYPNDEHRKLFKIAFYEIYKSKRHHFKGNKELLAELKGDKIEILVEK